MVHRLNMQHKKQYTKKYKNNMRRYHKYINKDSQIILEFFDIKNKNKKLI